MEKLKKIREIENKTDVEEQKQLKCGKQDPRKQENKE